MPGSSVAASPGASCWPLAAAAGAWLATGGHGRLAYALEAATIPHTIAPDASPRFRAVAERLLAAMAEHQVPGAALGILADGREEHAVFGVASLETKAPVTADTRFQIGSLTKTYTGTAVMRLIDQGKLDLYAPVRTYLPDLRLMDEDVAARVTVRNLLTHTGGWWGDDASDTGDGDDAIARYVTRAPADVPAARPARGVLQLQQHRVHPARSADRGRHRPDLPGGDPGARARPARADGIDLRAARPSSGSPTRSAMAAAHRGRRWSRRCTSPRNVDPAGGLWSTTRDQLRYARFHLGDGTAPDGTRLLAPYTLGLMRTPQVAIPGAPSLAMGMNWFVQDLPGLQLAMHGGDTFGQHTAFMFAPGRGFAFVLLTNS